MTCIECGEDLETDEEIEEGICAFCAEAAGYGEEEE